MTEHLTAALDLLVDEYFDIVEHVRDDLKPILKRELIRGLLSNSTLEFTGDGEAIVETMSDNAVNFFYELMKFVIDGQYLMNSSKIQYKTP